MKVEMQSVSKKFGKVTALDDVSLAIEPAQIVSVVGPNGSGKTTLLRCLASVMAPSSGEILLDGEKLARGNLPLRYRIAFLPDFPLAFPAHTLLQHVGTVLRLYGLDGGDRDSRVLELFERFDLLPLIDTPIGTLSRGQAYKTALTALLVIDAELLLLDEPFASGMDPSGILVLKQEVRAAASRGRTVIYSTQILDIAEKLSDRVCIIHRGKVLQYSPLSELQASVPRGSIEGALEQIFQKLREGPS